MCDKTVVGVLVTVLVTGPGHPSSNRHKANKSVQRSSSGPGIRVSVLLIPSVARFVVMANDQLATCFWQFLPIKTNDAVSRCLYMGQPLP